MNVAYDHLSVSDVAAILKVSKWTIYNIIESGVVPQECLTNISNGTQQARWLLYPGFVDWYKSYLHERSCERKENKIKRKTRASADDVEALLSTIAELEDRINFLERRFNKYEAVFANALASLSGGEEEKTVMYNRPLDP